MNLRQIWGFITTFWPVLAGGGLALATPFIDWTMFGGVLAGSALSTVTYRFQSGEWPWRGPRYQG